MNPSQQVLNRDDSLSHQDEALVADRRRVWQVRKYCQVRPSIVQHSAGGTDSVCGDGETASFHGEHETADPAMAALLRGVLKQLNADLVGFIKTLVMAHTLTFSGHGLAFGRPYTVLSVWSHQ